MLIMRIITYGRYMSLMATMMNNSRNIGSKTKASLKIDFTGPARKRAKK